MQQRIESARHAVAVTVATVSLLNACAVMDGSTRAPAIADATEVGTIGDQLLTEASGMTPSSKAGVFWLNNDSGNDPLIFAMDSAGRPVARVRVNGATNIDWEAIAAGPCNASHCLYLGDVGDNRARRRHVVLYRVAEPALDSAATRASNGDDAADRRSAPALLSAPVDSVGFTYPDGPHDVEAMWVAPDTSVWLVTKRPLHGPRRRLRHALLFRLAPDAWHGQAGAIATAELVDSLPIMPANGDEASWVTDAAFIRNGPDGPSIVVRTYQEALVFEASPITGRPGALRARCSLRELHERSGEAVAWLPDGRLFFANEGKGSRLWTGRC